MSQGKSSNTAFLERFRDKIQKMNKAGDLISKSSSDEDKKTAAESTRSGKKRSRNYFKMFKTSLNSSRLTPCRVKKATSKTKQKKDIDNITKEGSTIKALFPQKNHYNHFKPKEQEQRKSPQILREKYNQPLSFLSLPKIYKEDILKKARDLREKIGQSMNVSSLDYKEVSDKRDISQDLRKDEGVIEMKLKLRYLKSIKRTNIDPRSDRGKAPRTLTNKEKKVAAPTPQKTERTKIIDANPDIRLLPKLKRVNIKTFLNGFETFGKLKTPMKPKKKLLKDRSFARRANSVNRSVIRTPRFDPYEFNRVESSQAPRSISNSKVQILPLPDHISQSEGVQFEILKVRE
ncbi:unnamed protein product [Moneuplotes crassus]|uniref:Uncharacterized protein n=1 Tax=Euplotes crassus TaxID=5936 RepID=A0AAD2DAV3_EUPCR|nr:unnamed protein product [Moneuplotes crassus]